MKEYSSLSMKVVLGFLLPFLVLFFLSIYFFTAKFFPERDVHLTISQNKSSVEVDKDTASKSKVIAVDAYVESRTIRSPIVPDVTGIDSERKIVVKND